MVCGNLKRSESLGKGGLMVCENRKRSESLSERTDPSPSGGGSTVGYLGIVLWRRGTAWFFRNRIFEKKSSKKSLTHCTPPLVT